VRACPATTPHTEGRRHDCLTAARLSQPRVVAAEFVAVFVSCLHRDCPRTIRGREPSVAVQTGPRAVSLVQPRTVCSPRTASLGANTAALSPQCSIAIDSHPHRRNRSCRHPRARLVAPHWQNKQRPCPCRTAMETLGSPLLKTSPHYSGFRRSFAMKYTAMSLSPRRLRITSTLPQGCVSTAHQSWLPHDLPVAV
jgi:hypothetical protein